MVMPFNVQQAAAAWLSSQTPPSPTHSAGVDNYDCGATGYRQKNSDPDNYSHYYIINEESHDRSFRRYGDGDNLLVSGGYKRARSGHIGQDYRKYRNKSPLSVKVGEMGSSSSQLLHPSQVMVGDKMTSLAKHVENQRQQFVPQKSSIPVRNPLHGRRRRRRTRASVSSSE